MFKRNRRPTSPGTILREFYLEPREISITELGRATGLTRKHLSNIVNGNASISPETAVRLAAVLGTTPQLWINLQNAVDLFDAAKRLQDEHWKPIAVHSAMAAE